MCTQTCASRCLKNLLSVTTIAITKNNNKALNIRTFERKVVFNNKNYKLKVNFKQLNKLAEMQKVLPFYASGEIVRGFGRGSKELGLPTANYSEEVVRTLPDALETGVYYGWANIDNGDVHKMVMSIGWNPFYNNKEKSMETHILHNYNKDLYGHLLKVCIVGHLREEKNFDSLDCLIAAIKEDIAQANCLLAEEDALCLKESEFFKKSDCLSNTTTTTNSCTNANSTKSDS